jgi:hypothetical protein
MGVRESLAVKVNPLDKPLEVTDGKQPAELAENRNQRTAKLLPTDRIWPWRKLTEKLDSLPGTGEFSFDDKAANFSERRENHPTQLSPITVSALPVLRCNRFEIDLSM